MGNYLNIPLSNDHVQVAAKHARIERTKSFGDWKNWFLESDVDVFKPLFSHYVERHGYSQDWTLNANPAINPNHGAEYIKKNTNAF